METVKKQFEKAAEEVKKLARRPDNDTLLKLYAFYKQATQGDVSGRRPGFTDFAGQAKYDAWCKVKGMPAQTAIQEYIALVKKLKG